MSIYKNIDICQDPSCEESNPVKSQIVMTAIRRFI